MADPRGNLALVYLALAHRYRPTWLVWENVPGVLSSNGGRDFGAFLGGLVELGYGFAYRVLDAQHFGLAQRRKRVFVVGYLGDWRPPAAVLFEPTSLRGDTAPRRTSRQDVAASVARSAGHHGGSSARGDGTDKLLVGTLGAKGRSAGSASLQEARQGQLIAGTLAGLAVGRAGYAADNVPAVVAFGGGDSRGSIDCAATITAHGSPRLDFESDTLIAFDPRQITSPGNRSAPLPGEPCHTLHSSASEPPAIAFNARQYPTIHDGVTNPLDTDGGSAGVAVGAGVRRLTPRECERLMGMPDDYTLIPWRTYQEAQRGGMSYESLLAARGMRLREPAGEACPDGPRYRAIGNSMAVPVVEWIGRRIERENAMVLEAPACA